MNLEENKLVTRSIDVFPVSGESEEGLQYMEWDLCDDLYRGKGRVTQDG